MEPTRCLAVLEDYRHLFEANHQMHCGPIASFKETLASKHLNPALNQVLECVVNMVNFIKSRPLKARFFKKLFEDIIGAEH